MSWVNLIILKTLCWSDHIRPVRSALSGVACCQTWPQHAPFPICRENLGKTYVMAGMVGFADFEVRIPAGYCDLSNHPRPSNCGRFVHFTVDLPQVSLGIWTSVIKSNQWEMLKCLSAGSGLDAQEHTSADSIFGCTGHQTVTPQYSYSWCTQPIVEWEPQWASAASFYLFFGKHRRDAKSLQLPRNTLDASLWRIFPKWIARFSFLVLQTSRLGWYNCWFSSFKHRWSKFFLWTEPVSRFSPPHWSFMVTRNDFSVGSQPLQESLFWSMKGDDLCLLLTLCGYWLFSQDKGNLHDKSRSQQSLIAWHRRPMASYSEQHGSSNDFCPYSLSNRASPLEVSSMGMTMLLLLLMCKVLMIVEHYEMEALDLSEPRM